MTSECPETVYTGSHDVVGHKCRRPVKEDGLCGLHLGAKRRREETDRRRRAEREANGQRQESAQQICNELEEVFGISARPAWDSITASFTGGVTLNAEESRRLVSRLTEALPGWNAVDQ